VLVVDLYAAEILRATGRESIPQTSWPGVALFTPGYQRSHIVQNQLFDLLEQHKQGRVFPKDLAAVPGRFVLLYRHAFLRDLVRAGCLTNAAAIWSQWEGYLARDYGAKAEAALRGENVTFNVIHTSGHASIGDLQRLAAAVAPSAIVPIHTFEALKYEGLFNNVRVRRDGEWWEIWPWVNSKKACQR
jgi:ribonuclease J